MILPGRRVSCSLLPAAGTAGGKSRNQHGQAQQVRCPAQRPRAETRVRAVVPAGLLRRDQPLAAVGQFEHQLQAAESAHPAQHTQVTALQRVPGLGDDHRGRQRGPHRHVSVTTCTRRPAAWQIAWAARAALTASMHSAASRKSTGMPPAMLAATSST